MYNCINCDKLESLYFKCDKCNKLLCRKCVSPEKHKCKTNNDSKYTLDMFCDNLDCIKNTNLQKCKYCKKNLCSDDFNKHKCKVKSCCIM